MSFLPTCFRLGPCFAAGAVVRATALGASAQRHQPSAGSLVLSSPTGLPALVASELPCRRALVTQAGSQAD